jgi:hypothetical protein
MVTSPRDAAIFIGDDGHVNPRTAHLAQQHVETLGLGHVHRRPHEFLDVERRAIGGRGDAQQVLGEQDADHLFAILVHHRKARVPAVDDRPQQHVGFVIAVQHRHLRARHHDVAHLDVPHRENALEHRQSIAFEHTPRRGAAQVFDDLTAILCFAGHAPRQLAQPGAAGAGFLFLVLVPGFFFGAHV